RGGIVKRGGRTSGADRGKVGRYGPPRTNRGRGHCGYGTPAVSPGRVPRGRRRGMTVSRWKVMAGVLGISLGGMAAIAGQAPKPATPSLEPPAPDGKLIVQPRKVEAVGLYGQSATSTGITPATFAPMTQPPAAPIDPFKGGPAPILAPPTTPLTGPETLIAPP